MDNGLIQNTNKISSTFFDTDQDISKKNNLVSIKMTNSDHNVCLILII